MEKSNTATATGAMATLSPHDSYQGKPEPQSQNPATVTLNNKVYNNKLLGILGKQCY